MARVAVTGATGQIGQPLTGRLLAEGHEVTVLSRDPERARIVVPRAAAYKSWSPGDNDPDLVDGADVVIGLAGAPFFKKWKSREEFDRVGTGGRVRANRGLVEAMAAAKHRPQVFISASAVGWYGFVDSDEEVTEASPMGTDSWAEGTESWEVEARAAERLAIRTVVVRTGIVLSQSQGMAANMAGQFKSGFGAIILPGTQWLPWIHIEDEVGLFMLAAEDDRVRGPLNASAPNPASFKEYAQAMGRVLGRPVWLRLPGLVMRLSLGDVADSVLHNRRMIPDLALRLGYTFRFPELEPALRDLLVPSPAPLS